MIVKVTMLVIFFAVMIGVGIASRQQASSVNGFVLGGRNVGPWLTAFAYGTSYFSAVVFVGYRNWKRNTWKSPCMGSSRTENKNYESSFEGGNYAGFFWKTI